MGDVLLIQGGWLINHGKCTTHSRWKNHQSWRKYCSFHGDESSVMEDVLLIPGGWIISHGGSTAHSRGMSYQSWGSSAHSVGMNYLYYCSYLEDVLLAKGGCTVHPWEMFCPLLRGWTLYCSFLGDKLSVHGMYCSFCILGVVGVGVVGELRVLGVYCSFWGINFISLREWIISLGQ